MCVDNDNYNPSYAFSITGALVSFDPGDYYETINYDWPIWNTCSCWQTIGNRCSPYDGTLGTSGGTFPPSSASFMITYRHYNVDPNLDYFYGDFTPPNGTSTVTETSTVYSENDDWEVYDDGGGYGDPTYHHTSLTETATLSVPYTPEILAALVNSNASSYGPWTDPPFSQAAGFLMATNTDPYSGSYGLVSAIGTKMQYRVDLPGSEKGKTYHYKWFETVRDRSGRIISRTKRTATVVGTGDSVNPVASEIITVSVPKQEGTVVEEDLTVDEKDNSPPTLHNPPVHSVPTPPLHSLPGGGGR